MMDIKIIQYKEDFTIMISDKTLHELDENIGIEGILEHHERKVAHIAYDRNHVAGKFTHF